MIDHSVITFLGFVVLVALSLTAYFIYGSWRSTRTQTKQRPPEVVTRQWLNREARNARHKAKVDSHG
jgi:cytochrome c-type biogenesis protein CcmH/NrfG